MYNFKFNWFTIDLFILQVYAVDARNHGDSDWNDFFNFDINVDDLLYTMDSLSIPKAVLVGHSMGGITALRTALKAVSRKLEQRICNLIKIALITNNNNN